MSPAPGFFTRWRVRLGYLLALIVFFFARPTPRAIVWGALLGAIGLLVRGYAAGYLRKHESLTVTGPYAFTRNPLYLGSAVLALGFAFATHSWISAGLIAGYFALFYAIVMRREEGELRAKFGSAFDDYARSVPLFLPRWPKASAASGTEVEGFSWARYKKNREYQAALGFVLVLGLLLLIWYFRRV